MNKSWGTSEILLLTYQIKMKSSCEKDKPYSLHSRSSHCMGHHSSQTFKTFKTQLVHKCLNATQMGHTFKLFTLNKQLIKATSLNILFTPHLISSLSLCHNKDFKCLWGWYHNLRTHNILKWCLLSKRWCQSKWSKNMSKNLNRLLRFHGYKNRLTQKRRKK